MGVFVGLFLGSILIQNIFIFFFPLLALKKKSLNKQKGGFSDTDKKLIQFLILAIMILICQAYLSE